MTCTVQILESNDRCLNGADHDKTARNFHERIVNDVRRDETSLRTPLDGAIHNHH